MRIQIESPTTADVVALLETHLAFSREASPPNHVHALDLDGLSGDDITFCTARRDGRLVGVGAVRTIDGGRAEIKSMHTSADAREMGVARQMLGHLMSVARETGATWLGIETGTMDEFVPARRLYGSAGFEVCAPFGDYTDNPYSVCMSTEI